MDAILRNFLGVKRADVTVQGITLIGGRNGAGKSSTLAGIAAALTQVPDGIRGVKIKRDLKSLVNDAATDGGVLLQAGQLSVQISYPDAQVTLKGAIRAASPYIVGTADLMALDDKQRADVLVQLVGANPTKEDVDKALEEAGDTILADTKEKIWPAIEKRGWDGSFSAVSEAGVKLKGAWRETTGQTWGVKVAEGWLPTTLREVGRNKDMTPREAKDGLELAQERLETAIKSEGATDQARRSARQQVDNLPMIEAQKTNKEAERDKALKRIEELTVEIDALPATHRKPEHCPWCEKPVRVVQKNSAFEIQKAVEEVDAPDAADKRMQRIDKEAERTRLMRQTELLDRDITGLDTQIEAANKAKEEMGDLPGDDEVKSRIDEMRRHVGDWTELVRAVEQRDRATEIHVRIKSNIAVAALLAPEGLRAAALKRKLEFFNARLLAISNTMQCAPISLGEDLRLRYAGRPLALAARSEQMRANLAMRLLLAQDNGVKTIIFDDFDAITPQSRVALLDAIREIGVNAVIGMLANDAALVPDLAKFGYGQSYWMEDGVASPTPAAQG